MVGGYFWSNKANMGSNMKKSRLTIGVTAVSPNMEKISFSASIVDK